MAENIFHQTVNVSLYEQLLRETCPAERSPTVSIEAQLSKDELNALRYASGYVPAKLLKKYGGKGERERKRLGNKLDQFEMCLGNMAVTNDNTDFIQYTTEWFH